MSILGQLDALRQDLPGCSLVAFADLRTRLVLTVSADNSRPQEQLDEMCFQAANCFEDSDTLVSALKTDGQGDQMCTESIVLTPVETRVFIRNPDGEGEALCCICQPTAKIDDFAQKSLQTLQQISAVM